MMGRQRPASSLTRNMMSFAIDRGYLTGEMYARLRKRVGLCLLFACVDRSSQGYPQQLRGFATVSFV